MKKLTPLICGLIIAGPVFAKNGVIENPFNKKELLVVSNGKIQTTGKRISKPDGFDGAGAFIVSKPGKYLTFYTSSITVNEDELEYAKENYLYNLERVKERCNRIDVDPVLLRKNCLEMLDRNFFGDDSNHISKKSHAYLNFNFQEGVDPNSSDIELSSLAWEVKEVKFNYTTRSESMLEKIEELEKEFSKTPVNNFDGDLLYGFNFSSGLVYDKYREGLADPEAETNNNFEVMSYSPTQITNFKAITLGLVPAIDIFEGRIDGVEINGEASLFTVKNSEDIVETKKQMVEDLTNVLKNEEKKTLFERLNGYTNSFKEILKSKEEKQVDDIVEFSKKGRMENIDRFAENFAFSTVKPDELLSQQIKIVRKLKIKK